MVGGKGGEPYGVFVFEGDKICYLKLPHCLRSDGIMRGLRLRLEVRSTAAVRLGWWELRDRWLRASRRSRPAQGDPPLAAGASVEPFFRLHFLGSLAPIERRTVAGDKSCIHCTNRAPKRQYTDSFFALCENWGGLYSPPLCWCLSTALFEASPIVLANVSYWPESVPAMFPGSKLRARECLKRGNRGLNAFCCIVVWPIKSKLRSTFMQTGNYVVTAAAIDIWLPPRGKRGWGACLSLQALKSWTLMILTENRGWISETDRSTRWILYPCRQK